MRTHRFLVLSALLGALGVPAAPAAGQTVLVHVFSAETSEPIFGALAHLVDAQGTIVRSVLTDQRGRGLFLAVPAASYRVRAEMIGMATRESEVFESGAAGVSTPLELRLDPSPIDLERIDVTAERGRRCVARPSQEGMVVATLWDEARKALRAAALTEQQGNYRYSTVRYERDYAPETRSIIRDEETRREGYMRIPFESLPPEDLMTAGFVREEGNELVYYAPDARVLLSDEFLDNHCFRVEENDSTTLVVGLHFEPTAERRRVTDITGTLWLDAATAELRWIDYEYWNLDLEGVSSAEAGGRVEFERLPAGTWIVRAWVIVMPVIESRIGDDRSVRLRVTRYRQAGGRVVEVHEGGGRQVLGRRATGGIEGVVVDSAGAPFVGARVGVVGAGQEIFTDAEGRFALMNLNEGVHRVRFVDPRLAQFGIEPEPVMREVIPNEMSYVEFHMPSVSEVLEEACRGQEMAPGTAMLAGRVVNVNGGPVSGATVRVTWSELQTVGGPGNRIYIEDRPGFEVTSASNGTYAFCGVPRGTPLDLSSRLGDQEEAAPPITIDAEGAGMLHELRRSR